MPRRRAANISQIFPALIAIECESAGVPGTASLDHATASALADALTDDLVAHIPEISSLDIVIVGAVYDQAQLLRPQWPLHGALADTLERLPRDAGHTRVVALGAHQGKFMHPGLEPDTRLLGSPMLVLPWLLSGEASIIDEVSQHLERELMDSGLIGAGLALAIGEAFGVKTAHARHMTTLDLCALACAQYEHAALGEIWQIIETALLRPDQAHTISLDDGSRLHYSDGVVSGHIVDARRLAQYRAILGAHGLTLVDHHQAPH